MSKVLDRKSSGLEANIIMRIGKAQKQVARRSGEEGHVLEIVRVLKGENIANNHIQVETGDEEIPASELCPV
jgi:hypothetical protein